MVAQKMGSQEGGSTSNGMARTQTQTHNPNPNPLARQGSLYGLTFDEVQNQLGDLGKPLSSMNLDELLKAVCMVEPSDQAMEPDPGSYSSQHSNVMILSTDLSKKTVDEVWQDIQQGQRRNCLDRKVTLGEMTLEDFLVRAGVVAESKSNSAPDRVVFDQLELPLQAQWMNYHQMTSPVLARGHHPVRQPVTIGGNPIIDCADYSETQMTVSSSSLMGTSSDTQTPGRKRVAPDDIAEKSVERRQKRMIKNRESAARSRARKQAYTQELENKVSCLQKENQRLKRQKELEMMLPSIPPPVPKYQLRRTSSAPI